MTGAAPLASMYRKSAFSDESGNVSPFNEYAFREGT